MQDPHTPRDGFVDRLEWQISSELRRRQRSGPATWLPSSPLKAAAAIVFVVLASMAAGGAAVAAAVQAQNNERRDVLVSGYERRVELARQRLALNTSHLRMWEREVAVGVKRPEDMQTAQLEVAEAERELKLLELDLQEVRLTGREPRAEISAPLVSGRDFVTERLQASLVAPDQALSVAKARAAATRRRVDVGLATMSDLAQDEARVLELEAAIAAIRSKLDIRRRFVAGQVTAARADLLVIEGEAEQRVKSLEPRIALARKNVEVAEQRLQVGVMTRVELAEAKLRLSELEADLAKAQLDLALIRKKVSEN